MSSQIHDLGYRAYTGARLGVPWAVRSLARHSIRRALGMKRPGKHKIVPVITIIFAFLPAVVLVGVTAFVPVFDPNELIAYGEYYGSVGFALTIFTAVAAPGVLTTDRTSGMLAMYLASPLTRTTYFLAKAIGIFAVMLIITAGPIVFLVVAYTFAGEGPGGVFDFLKTFGRAVVAGSLAALFFTGLGMFVSSIPKRWGVASVAIVGSLLIPVAVVRALAEAGVTKWVWLLSPSDVMNEAWQVVFSDRITRGSAITQISDGPIFMAALAYGLFMLALTWWRYQTMSVDR